MARRRRTKGRFFEVLESRRLLATFSTLPPPDPIVPNNGEATILHVAQEHADQGNIDALDNIPIPFVIDYQAGGGTDSTQIWHAGAPQRLDVDGIKATGQGGRDFDIEVNTIRPSESDDWSLHVFVERLGKAPFAEGAGFVITFPFAAFNDEALPGPANIVLGFEVDEGGAIPESVGIHFSPHQLADGTHDFEWEIETSGATSPITFLGGHFDGDFNTGYLNGMLASFRVEDVPGYMELDVSTVESDLGGGAMTSSFDIDWMASSPTPLELIFVEGESAATAASFETADFTTTVATTMMPTSEHLSLSLDESTSELTLSSHSNASLGDLSIRKERSDGLTITADATDVPTSVDLVEDLAGGAQLDVDANTLDLNIQASKQSGFDSTDGLLGYNLGYLGLQVEDAPDLTASFDAAETSLSVAATNAGEQVPFLEFIVDDDAAIAADNTPSGLELPPSYDSSDDTPLDPRLHHLFSLVDDGVHGTAMGRVIDVDTVIFDHDQSPLKESLDFVAGSPTPLQFYLRTGIDSNILVAPPGATGPDPYAEVTCNADDIQAGQTHLELFPPLGFSVAADAAIDSISCGGHVGTLEAGLLLEDVPTVSSFDFRPEGSVAVTAEDASGQPDAFGAIVAHLIDENGFDPNVIPLPAQGETFFPADTRLKEARLRLDHVPSFNALWHDLPDSTVIQLDTALDASLDPSDPFAYLAGFQVAVATMLPADPQIDLTSIPAAGDASEHYARLVDQAGGQSFEGGVFGVDNFHFDTDDVGADPSSFVIDWNLRPDRPFTPFVLDVDTTGLGDALGTFFGDDDVFGTLDLGYVPSQLQLTANLDPEVCTNGLFGIPLPIPSTLNLNLNVQGNQIRVYAEDLPPVFCVAWETEGANAEVQVLAEELNGDPAQAEVVEVLFQTPPNELRIRADQVPSLEATWNQATSNPNFTLGTAADPGEPFSILGGLRLRSSTTIGPTTIPVFPDLIGDEPHFVEFKDQGADKNLEVAIFGVDEVGVLVNSALGTVHVDYLGDTSRPLGIHIGTQNGLFFPNQTVDFAILVEDLPSAINMVLSTAGDAMFMTASDGVDRIRLGTPDLLNPPPVLPPNESTEPEPGFIDTREISLDLVSLPDHISYSLSPDQTLQLLAESCPGFPDSCVVEPSSIDRFAVHLRDETAGLEGDEPMFAEPIRDVRIRVDHIPSLAATWGEVLDVGLRNPAFFEDPPVADDVVIVRSTDNEGVTRISTALVARDSTQEVLHITGVRGAALAKDAIIDVLDRLDYSDQDELFFETDHIIGGTSGATGVIRRLDRTADRGSLYIENASGEFQDGETLFVTANVIDGALDVDFSGVIDGKDDGFFGGVSIIDGRFDTNGDTAISGDDDGFVLGLAVGNGRIDINEDNVISTTDDGTLYDARARVRGELHDATDWGARIKDPALSSGFAADFGTVADGQFIDGMQIALSSQLTLDDPLPEPTPSSAHRLRLTDVRTSSSSAALPKQFDFQVFGVDDVHIQMDAETEMRFEADAARGLDIDVDRDFGGAFFAEDNDIGMRLDIDVDAIPQSLELRTDMANFLDYQASSAIDMILIDGQFDEIDDGGPLNFQIIGGQVDYDDDGDIDADDQGAYDGVAIIDGRFDIDEDGDVDLDDDGQVAGVAVVDGYLDVNDNGDIDVSDLKDRNGTEVEFLLVGLPAEMSFGLTLAPVAIYDGRLNLNIREEAQVGNGFIDIDGDNEITEDDDGRFAGVNIIDGQFDVDDDGEITTSDDGLVLDFDVIDGRIDINEDGGINGDDDGELTDEEINEDDMGRFAGFPFMLGELDMNEDGVVNSLDDGTVLDVEVINGHLDFNGDGEIDEDDDGVLSGLKAEMSDEIELFDLRARAVDDAFGMFDTDYRLLELTAAEVPADTLLVWTDERFRFETKDAAGDPTTIGQISAMISTSIDAAQIDQRLSAFQSTDPGPAGDVLDGTTPLRINYSEYLQAIDERYFDASDAPGVIDRLRQVYANGPVLTGGGDYVAARMFGQAADLLALQLSGFQSARANWAFDVYDIPFNDVENEEDTPLVPFEDPTIPVDVDFELRAPSDGLHPLFFGFGNSTADRSAMDGEFVGVRVIDGKLDINEDGEVHFEDDEVNEDDGSAAGFAVIDGRLDVNDDGSVDETDDRFVNGVRVQDGYVDVSEQIIIADIGNVPDRVQFDYNFENEKLSLRTDDDEDASAGRIDIYQGPLYYADDNDVALRVVLVDAPESVTVDWGLDFLHGGVNVNSSGPFELLGAIQNPTDAGDFNRFVFGLEMEDLQIGYDVELFSLDVVEEVEINLGNDIINGRIDINNDHEIDGSDDGFFGGFLGIGSTPVINGELDVNGDGDINGADDGVVGNFIVFDGRVDVDEDGDVDSDDDFNASLIELPSAWELFSAEVGIDNDADDPNIEGNVDKPGVSGFLAMYTLTANPESLDPTGPAPGSGEYLPNITLMLKDFREASLESRVLLDPVSPNIGSLFPALGVLPFQLDLILADLDGDLFFDYWGMFDFDLTFGIDYPDWVPLDDITIGITSSPDYIDNTPLHLLPITGLYATTEMDFIWTLLGLHDFDIDHWDPFDD